MDSALIANWKVIQQEGKAMVVEYQIPDQYVEGGILTYKIRIDNFNPAASEELLKEAIKGAVRTHYRNHRFIGMKGSVELTSLGTDDDESESEEKGENRDGRSES